MTAVRELRDHFRRPIVIGARVRFIVSRPFRILIGHVEMISADGTAVGVREELSKELHHLSPLDVCVCGGDLLAGREEDRGS